MRRLLHDPAVRDRLRKLRPMYNAVFRRTKDLSRLPSPEDCIARMQGRGAFLFAFGRSGTTVFADFLETHPDILTFGEVLNEDSYYSYFQSLSRGPLRWWSFRPSLMEAHFYPYLTRLVQGSSGSIGLFDMKIEGLHLVEGNWRQPGPHFKIYDVLKNSDAPVILLERRDLVARHVSARVAIQRGAFHSYHTREGADIEPFEIDLVALDAQVSTIRRATRHIRETFADHPKFTAVVYEDLFDDKGQFAPDLSSRMAALLGVEDKFQPAPRLERVSGKGYDEMITNWSAVVAYRDKLLSEAIPGS